MFRFDGKTIIVTGGARGQGAVEARMLVAAGANVVIGDVRDREGEALAQELGASARFVHHDVTSEEDWASAVIAAEGMGNIAGLVNNAGIYVLGSIMDTSRELFDKHVSVNQTGCFLGMRAVADAMTRSGGGSIVNISSVGGLRGSPGAFAYCATKWAMRGMTKAAALDFAERNIRVNSVHPGFVDTEMLNVRSKDALQTLVQNVPLKRMAEPEEISTLVLFLLSEESSFITGSEYVIDGGGSL